MSTPEQSCNRCGHPSADLVDGICANCRSIDQETLPVTPTPGNEMDATLATPPSHAANTPALGRFGDYELMEEVGRGGMGVIYKARHLRLNRITALKMILGGRFSSEDELQRFHVEAEAAAGLDHPGIVPVYEIGETDGQAFFAMKFIEGGSLANHMEHYRHQPQLAVEMLSKVARAVHHAHQRGILHRDLKPANILISDDEPMVTDLGLAKKTAEGSDITNTGAVLGTPSYMPPEQASGSGSITTAADIYSLGAILYELLTGSPPFRGSTPVETVMQVMHETPDYPHVKNPHVNRDLELICMKCLQRDPEARFATAAALANDLDSWLEGEPISVKPPSFGDVAGRWFRRNQKLVYVGFALLTGMMITMPFVFSVFGESSSGGDVYRYFPDEQRPWLFSFETMPAAVFVTASVLLFTVLWPSIGLLNVHIVRPKSVRGALGAGVLTAFLLSIIYTVLLGWMVLLQGSVIATNNQIRVLARAVWSADEMQQTEAIANANAMYGGLDQIPVAQRANIVADRITSDQLASAPASAVILLIFISLFALPVIYGTVIAHVLVQRGNRFLVCLIRYAIAWWSVSFGIVAFLAGFVVAGPQINGQPANQFTGSIIVAIGICLLITFFVMRQWKGRRAEATAL